MMDCYTSQNRCGVFRRYKYRRYQRFYAIRCYCFGYSIHCFLAIGSVSKTIRCDRQTIASDRQTMTCASETMTGEPETMTGDGQTMTINRQTMTTE